VQLLPEFGQFDRGIGELPLLVSDGFNTKDAPIEARFALIGRLGPGAKKDLVGMRERVMGVGNCSAVRE
jgi:hypothetical protein